MSAEDFGICYFCQETGERVGCAGCDYRTIKEELEVELEGVPND